MPTRAGGRHLVVKVRLAQSEHDELRGRADTAGVSVQRLLFDAAMAGTAAAAAERRRAKADAERSRLVLTNIANNVNQLAKWANTHYYLPHTIADVLDDVRRAAVAVAETTERLGSSFEERR